jgi:ABC-type polysaccharide/polyol phosphate export permease
MTAMLSDVRELWAYRSLLRMLVVRDLKARYRNSALGVLWSFLQPLGMMIVMSFVAGSIRPDTPSNWHIYILAGLLSWNFFAAAVTSGSNSIMANAPLVKKVYFPRLVLPISAVCSALVNYLLSLPMFIVVALVSGHSISQWVVLIPIVILIQTVFSIGIVLVLSTLNVFYRDTAFIVDLSMLALFFLTPIMYDMNNITRTMSGAVWVRRLNPMASIVNMYQDILYRGVPTSLDFVLRTAVTALVIGLIGYFVFRAFSHRFGEEV